MEAYQYKIRKEKALIEELDFDVNLVDLKNTEIKLISKSLATQVILEYEWLHSIPLANKYFFGIYFNVEDKQYIGGVLIFGIEYSENTGVWKKYDYEGKMLLLSRGVCLWWTPKNTASFFISKACKWIKDNTEYKIITATVDPAAGEVGIIYQSLNWKYVGLMSGNYHGNKMASRFGVMIDGKLRFSRWIRKKIGSMKHEEILKYYPNAIFVPQFRKQRYFYFIGNRRENMIFEKNIKHLLLPYPKRNIQISGIIYKIENIINGKVYIGQTIRSFQDRINEYKKRYGNDYLNNAIDKYGWNNFVFSIIDTAETIDELNNKEIYYIDKYKSNISQFGYNLELGGKNSIPSTSTIEKMSKSHLGIKQTDIWVKNRIAESGTDEAKKYGKKKNDEDKEHLSINSPKYWKGKTRSEETKLKISITKKEKGLSEKQKNSICKEVFKIDVINNQVVQKYESTSKAELFEKVNQSTISRWCKANKVIDGIRWSYNQ